jgi:DNA-directed RNA polymerase III subunit RPC8
MVWIWTTEEGNECFYDKNEPVRLRIETEIWHDLTPQKPNFEATNGDAPVVKPVCYSIIGSMQQAGLGPFLWWQEEEEGEEEMEGEVEGEGEGEAMET